MTTSDEAVAALKRLAGTGVAALIGTCNRQRIPELSRAWGIAVSDGGETVNICVYVGVGRRTIANLADHSLVAVTMTRPSTYRSLQIKGRAVRVVPASEQDIQRVSDHQRAFVEEAVAVGVSRAAATSLTEVEKNAGPDLMSISVAVEAVFDQTPGPGAGARV